MSKREAIVLVVMILVGTAFCAAPKKQVEWKVGDYAAMRKIEGGWKYVTFDEAFQAMVDKRKQLARVK